MKINNEFVKGEVKEILPKIFALSIKDRYQRAMLFCRYQEFYESPYNEIRGKEFSWEKFMLLYKQKNREQIFTYPKDWSGFNIPSKIIEKGLSAFSFRTWGPYDRIMSDIWYHCENYPLRSEKPRTKWYLIGADNFKSNTMDHEIAHGLFYTNPKYKSNCLELIKEIKSPQYNKMKKTLVSMGYHNDEKIINDEIQAYMSTGLINKFDVSSLKKYQNKFIENFKNFKK